MKNWLQRSSIVAASTERHGRMLSKGALGRRSKRKGMAYEREVADRFRAIWPEAKRGIGQTRAGGEVPDIQGTPFWCEAKHRKALNLTAAMRQAEVAWKSFISRGGNPNAYRCPIVIARLDTARGFEKRTDLVVLRIDDFIALLSEWSAHAATGCEVETQPGMHVPAMPETSGGDPRTGSQTMPARQRK